MAWKECDRVSLRREFVELASAEGANVAALCRRFGVSRKTGYKWLTRFRADGTEGLTDRSRRPRVFHKPTPEAMERTVLALRDEHPAWGGRKLHARLKRLGHANVPTPSTITAILHRHGRIEPAESRKRQAWRRFERERPNELWQMDFKGELRMLNGRWCYPLTVLDDHSRYALGLQACGDQKRRTVRGRLRGIFRRYGLPWSMLMDNGVPWAVGHNCGGYTKLTAWLIRLDIRVLHGRPYHPQTQGKDERFHRTLQAELLRGRSLVNLTHTQEHFDPWRQMYNHDRPHEALDMQPPASRYRISERTLPERLPPIEYGPGVQVRKVNAVGQVRFEGRTFKTSEAFAGEPVGLRPTATDGVWEVYFCHQRVGRADLRVTPRGESASAALPASGRYAPSGGQSSRGSVS